MQCLYALDFDGVICDSAVETGITGWKAASVLWEDMADKQPEETVLSAFRHVRPALETGYEAILIMRLLCQGMDAHYLLNNYTACLESLVHDESLDVNALKRLFGEIRDIWIDNDYQQWMQMNPLFPGVAEKLKKLPASAKWYIVTTKQERFVKHILKANQIELPEQFIFGLDRAMRKSDVLSQLQNAHPLQVICFIEDRLPALEEVVQREELRKIRLYLANWGYNTEQDRQAASHYPISVINVNQFLELEN